MISLNSLKKIKMQIISNMNMNTLNIFKKNILFFFFKFQELFNNFLTNLDLNLYGFLKKIFLLNS